MITLALLLVMGAAFGEGASDEKGADHSPDVVGHRLMELGHFEEAADFYRQALSQDPDNVQACVSLGTSLCKLDRISEAMQSFGRCIARKPQAASLYVARGLCEQEKGAKWLTLAEADYKKALALEPGKASAHNQLGLIYQSRGDHHFAMHEFRAAIDASPGFAVAYNNLAASLIAMGRYEEAITILQEAIAAKSDLKGIYLYTNLGIAFLRADKIPEAEAAFLLETAINPDYPEAHLNLGNLYALSRRPDDAIYEYHRVLMSDPDHQQALTNMGAIYATTGKPEEAKKYLEKAVSSHPRSALAHHYLAVVYEALGDDGRARQAEERARELGYQPGQSPWPAAIDYNSSE